MDVLVAVFRFIGLAAFFVLFWCLYKIYVETSKTNKKIMQFSFWLLLMVLVCCFVPAPVREKAIYRGGIGAAATAVVLLMYWILILLPIWTRRAVKAKVKQSKLEPFKIEIVNNEKYLHLKKTERIAFLRDLRKQTVMTLTKQRKVLEIEGQKLKDIPKDVAKYVKTQDLSIVKKSLSKQEYKLMAIDELIEAENGTK